MGGPNHENHASAKSDVVSNPGILLRHLSRDFSCSDIRENRLRFSFYRRQQDADPRRATAPLHAELRDDFNYRSIRQGRDRDRRSSGRDESDCIPRCTITFAFDPRGLIPLIDEFHNRDIYVTDMLFDDNDPNRKIVSFQSDPEPNLRPARLPQHKADSGGSTLSYDAATEVVRFSGHHLVGTGFPGDPILGADVLIPDFQVVTGTEDHVVIFIARTDPTFEISLGGNVYLRARLTLDYRADENTFLGILTDFTFSSFGSPWIAAMADLFNPASPDFNPDLKLYFTYAPRDNFLDLTQSFTVNAISGGSDSLFAAQATPEPSALLLLGLGLVAVLVMSKSQRMRRRAGTSIPAQGQN